MTAIVGNDGDFTMASGGGLLNTWRATFSNVVSEITGFSETGNRRHRTGLLNIEGSASGVAQKDVATSDPDATTRDAGFEETITLTVAALCTYAFGACFSAVSFDVNKVGDTLLTFDFTTGETTGITPAWDEA